MIEFLENTDRRFDRQIYDNRSRLLLNVLGFVDNRDNAYYTSFAIYCTADLLAAVNTKRKCICVHMYIKKLLFI